LGHLLHVHRVAYPRHLEKEIDMTTTVVKVKMNHVFDVRSEFAIRELKMKRTTQPIRCIKCKKLVTDPDSSCSFVQKEEVDGK
jgi:hypothetical protein